MARQRTKVAEWWERRWDTGAARGFLKYDTEADARASKAAGGTLHHVTRYRLAPPVRLRWVPDGSHIDARAKNNALIATVYSDGEWRIWFRETQSSPNVAEAKAACAARLRELGYRVVDE